MFLQNSSRLTAQRFIIDKDYKNHWELVKTVIFPLSQDDVYYEYKETDRLDLLALKFYNDSGLWWTILAANKIGYAAKHLTVGKKIRIPAWYNVDAVLKQNKITRQI